MPHTLLNRTSSYASCYSAVTNSTPRLSLSRYGSIENLLHGHTKSQPANVRVLIRKNFQPFAQVHLPVSKGKWTNEKRFSKRNSSTMIFHWSVFFFPVDLFEISYSLVGLIKTRIDLLVRTGIESHCRRFAHQWHCHVKTHELVNQHELTSDFNFYSKCVVDFFFFFFFCRNHCHCFVLTRTLALRSNWFQWKNRLHPANYLFIVSTFKWKKQIRRLFFSSSSIDSDENAFKTWTIFSSGFQTTNSSIFIT